MRTLFIRTLTAFIGSFCIFLIVLFFLLYSGYTRSADRWKTEKHEKLIAYSLQYLSNPNSPDLSPPAADLPLFILNKDLKLLFSNRGKGTAKLAGLTIDDFIPIYHDDSLLGYIWTQNYRFQDDSANQEFLDSMKKSIYLGVCISLPLFFLLAFFLSKSLSGPAEKVAQGLDKISQGNLDVQIPEKAQRKFPE